LLIEANCQLCQEDQQSKNESHCFSRTGRFALAGKNGCGVYNANGAIEALRSLSLLTHSFKLDQIVEAYDAFASRRAGCLKVAIKP